MDDEVDGGPVADGVAGLQQDKAHAHVVIGPHLEEPVDPVKDVLARGPQSGPDGGLHGSLSRDAQGDGEEGQVVASMEPMPVCTDEHGPTRPQCVSFEGRVRVDVVMQPPLYSHIPVAHPMADLHTEVCVVAINVLDGLEVV